MNTHKIVLGGGCFWCLDPIFRNLTGVTNVTAGYAGGEKENPSYREVCSGKTGHAEVLEIEYDSTVVSLKKILKIFFSMHDPTTLNKQGADTGTQYRSIILYSMLEQKKIIHETLQTLKDSQAWEHPIVTEVEELATFYPAEEEHQNYFKKHPEAAYCQIVIAPKMQKFNEIFGT